MPLYVYGCPNGHKTEDIRRVEHRHDPTKCETCGEQAGLEVQTAAFDPRLGLDPGFPTMQDKWAKARERAARAKQ